MKIGYPCINRSIGCTAGKTFRLKSYSSERMAEAVENNLHCLEKILQYNVLHSLKFFRISSDMIPFASHPVCDFPWQERFEPRFGEIGRFIRDHDIRISMHPDQFTLINAVDPLVVRRGEHELLYHAEVLDLLGLDLSAKIQIHVGGVYGDKEGSIRRFIDRYWKLDEAIRRRLVIENDGQLYALHDCMKIHERCGIPVLFDAFHHNINSSGEDLQTALSMISRTWVDHDGIPMVDYSNHKPGGRHGAHAERIDLDVFKEFLKGSKPFDFDLMLEIKDKERSAAAAVEKARSDPRFAA